MAEFVIKLADERGRVQEQVQTAATAEELRARFSHAGYHVFSVKRALAACGGMSRRKVKLEPFLIFNQQFLTLIRAGLPILGSLQMLAKIQKNAHFRRPAGRRCQPREDRRIAFRGLRGAERLSRSCTPPPCWPASAPATCRRCWSATSASSASRSPSARS